MSKLPASWDRQIFAFAQPLYPNTPYLTDFSEEVLAFCSKGPSHCGLIISKVIFLGDVGVGKTSIVKRLCANSFETNYKPTVGIDFEVERFDILGIPFNLQIWDTAGQERFRSIATAYYRGADGLLSAGSFKIPSEVIVLVYDMSKVSSLINCTNWLKSVLAEYKSLTRPYILLVGNKIDAVSSITQEKMEECAVTVSEHMKAEYWSVSSKFGTNITELFLRMASLAFHSCVLKELKNSKPLVSTFDEIKIDKRINLLNQNRFPRSCGNCS